MKTEKDPALIDAHFISGLAYGLAYCKLGQSTELASDSDFVKVCDQTRADLEKLKAKNPDAENAIEVRAAD